MSALKTNGAHTEGLRTTGPALAYETGEPSYKGAGWVLFSTIMFVAAACLSVI
ncbi:MAG TPA: hypothetical protein VFB39_14815 [Solirubrobacteraceae bacterium]|nr:hypothetical protein [Solirubrobacteraceae bacterium]